MITFGWFLVEFDMEVWFVSCTLVACGCCSVLLDLYIITLGILHFDGFGSGCSAFLLLLFCFGNFFFIFLSYFRLLASSSLCWYSSALFSEKMYLVWSSTSFHYGLLVSGVTSVSGRRILGQQLWRFLSKIRDEHILGRMVRRPHWQPLFLAFERHPHCLRGIIAGGEEVISNLSNNTLLKVC